MIGAAVALVVLAGCSDSGSSSPTTNSETTATTEASDATSTVDTMPATTASAATSTTPTTEVATTTTEPPTPVPLGVRWTESTTLAQGVKGLQGTQFLSVDDELWAMVDLLDATRTFVSRDGGATFTEVQIAPAQQGSTRVTGILRRPDGGYLAYGSLGYECFPQEELTEDYVGFQICTRFRGMTWRSDDGTTWTQVEPSGLTGPGDSVFRLRSMVSTASGYVAAATIASLDWHSRLYTSADGITWNLARELRGEGTGPMSIDALLTDGTDLLLLGAEHTCAQPQASNNSFQPDVGFVYRPRVYLGTTVDDLALVPDADVPFVQLADPNETDCTALDSFDRGQLPRVELDAEVVGERLALVAVAFPGTDAEFTDEEEATGGRRQVAFLVDGTWQPTTIEGVSMLDEDHTISRVVDTPGTPAGFAIVEADRGREFQVQARVMTDTGDGSIAPLDVEHPFLADTIGDVVGAGTELLAIGDRVTREGVTNASGFQVPRDIVVWTSTATTGAPETTCDLVPGGSCRFGDLSTVDGYPDFSGRDLSGVDLAIADLGEAVFDGANLSGAVLWAASGAEPSFVGADLTGAQLQYADIGSVAGANLSGADLTEARLDDATGGVFAGAVLRGTLVPLDAPTDLTGAFTVGVRLMLDADLEWSLAGLDLTDSYIDATFTDTRTTVRIVDLTGTVLEWANLTRVDLTGTDVTGVDLSNTVFDDESLCPDGLPPTPDVYRGGCVR